jgi:hypothetical protein
MILIKNFHWFQCWKIAEIACLNLVTFTRDNYMAAQLVLLIYRSTLTPSSSSTVFTGSRSNNALASRRWKVHSRHRVLVVSHLLSETILTWIRDLDFDEPDGSPRSDGPLWWACLIQGHPGALSVWLVFSKVFKYIQNLKTCRSSLTVYSPTDFKLAVLPQKWPIFEL